ncbi:MAG: tetratricopeptide repeat protein [Myxococcota bacterium]
MDWVWKAFQEWWAPIDWGALGSGAWTMLAPHWPWVVVGVGAAMGLGGLVLGMRLARSRRIDLGSADVLTAMERVVRGDRRGALQILELATASPQAPPELYLALASLLRALGHPQRSAWIHLGLTRRPNMDETLRTRATLGLAADYLTLGRSSEAEQLLKQLPRGVRRQEALLALRRNAALKAHDWKEALAMGRLLARRSDQGGGVVSEVYSQMAEAALARGNEKEAATNWRRALGKDPTDIHAREGLARLYAAQGKHFRARRHLTRAMRDHPELAPRLLPLMRVALKSRDRYQTYLDQLQDQGLGSPWVELEQAELAYTADHLDDALAILDDLVRRYPTSIDVREAYLNLLIATADERTIFAEMDRFMALAGALVDRFGCDHCGYRSPSAFARCPRCGEVGTARYELLT